MYIERNRLCGYGFYGQSTIGISTTNKSSSIDEEMLIGFFYHCLSVNGSILLLYTYSRKYNFEESILGSSTIAYTLSYQLCTIVQ